MPSQGHAHRLQQGGRRRREPSRSEGPSASPVAVTCPKAARRALKGACSGGDIPHLVYLQRRHHCGMLPPRLPFSLAESRVGVFPVCPRRSSDQDPPRPLSPHLPTPKPFWGRACLRTDARAAVPPPPSSPRQGGRGISRPSCWHSAGVRSALPPRGPGDLPDNVPRPPLPPPGVTSQVNSSRPHVEVCFCGDLNGDRAPRLALEPASHCWGDKCVPTSVCVNKVLSARGQPIGLRRVSSWFCMGTGEQNSGGGNWMAWKA